MPYTVRGKLLPGDPDYGTRWATEAERLVAKTLLDELAHQHLRIVLIPAPRPSFVGHKTRRIERENPRWYQGFLRGRWNRRGCQVKRSRVERALRRVTETGIVRRNGYERQLLDKMKLRVEGAEWQIRILKASR